MNVFDTVIIGKGPSGISAALYLARAKKNIIVIGKDIGSLAKAEKIENYYGLETPLTGEELANRGIKQVTDLGVPVMNQEVTSIDMLYPGMNSESDLALQKGAAYSITTPSEIYMAKTVLFATGKQRTALKVPGFSEYRGKGISFCAVCDGFFYRNKTVGIVGNGMYGVTELAHLFELTKDITFFTNGLPLDPEAAKLIPKEIPVVMDVITAIQGNKPAEEGGVVSSLIAGGKTYSLQGIFVALGTAGATDFAAKLGLATGEGSESGTLIVDKEYKTTVPGIFAAGDAVGGFLQVAKAVADGALAAKSILDSLRK
jgi:thioredoxin reductase (NADPH)